MAQLTLRARGPASAEVVWLRYAEPSRWSSWSPQVRGVDYPHARLRPQTTGRVRGPWRLAVPFRVEAVDEVAQTWSWTVQPQLAGRVITTVRLDHGVTPAPAASRRDRRGRAAKRAAPRSATWLRLRGHAPVIATYAPIARIALRHIVR
ncbi:MAG: hypothetical protein WA892_14350 [Ornithinimicrobium sp.]